MTVDIQRSLAAAYARQQVKADRAGALEMLRKDLAAPNALSAAVKKRDELAEIVKARSQGPVCGCHVTKVTYDLLAEAISGMPHV